jgi:hypothetical protein
MSLTPIAKRLSFTFIAALLCIQVSAQTLVQWASRVEDYSSELSELQNSAGQVIGKPNVLPSGGDNPSAWSPFNNNTKEYIKVSFDLPIPIVQIAIGETYNPGAVREVYTYDEKGKERLVYSVNPGPIKEPVRMLRIMMERTAYNVAAVKVVIDGKSVDGFSTIDCIGISNDETPIEAKVNLVSNINTKLIVERLNENVNSTSRENKEFP